MSNIFQKVGHLFAALFHKIFSSAVAKEFGQASLHLLESELGKIALAAVKNLSYTTLASESKRSAAFNVIVSAAKSAGLDYSTSIVNLLIEVATQAVKGAFNAIESPSSAPEPTVPPASPTS